MTSVVHCTLQLSPYRTSNTAWQSGSCTAPASVEPNGLHHRETEAAWQGTATAAHVAAPPFIVHAALHKTSKPASCHISSKKEGSLRLHNTPLRGHPQASPSHHREPEKQYTIHAKVKMRRVSGGRLFACHTSQHPRSHSY